MLPLLILGGIALYFAAKNAETQAVITEDRQGVQRISTGKGVVALNKRENYYLGNSGSVREIMSLPEDHGRGEAVEPYWRRFAGHHGSIKDTPQGTFIGIRQPELGIHEETHVTPQREGALSRSVMHRTWQSGGPYPSTGTFG